MHSRHIGLCISHIQVVTCVHNAYLWVSWVLCMFPRKWHSSGLTAVKFLSFISWLIGYSFHFHLSQHYHFSMSFDHVLPESLAGFRVIMLVLYGLWSQTSSTFFFIYVDLHVFPILPQTYCLIFLCTNQLSSFNPCSVHRWFCVTFCSLLPVFVEMNETAPSEDFPSTISEAGSSVLDGNLTGKNATSSACFVSQTRCSS